MKGKVNIWFLILFALLSCQQGQNEHQKNEHHPQNDKQTIYTMDGLDHGLIQSPVNILTLNTKNHIERDIEVIDEKPAMSSKVENTGHSVQLDFDEGIVIRLDSNYYDFLHQLSVKGNTILERCHPQCPAQINAEAVVVNLLLNNNVLLNFSLKHNSNLFYGIYWNKTSSTVKYSLKICQ